MIEISGMNFSYPESQVPALQDLNLSVRKGSLFGLLGPNGSGKTTLISILSGLLPAPKGRISIAGRDLSGNLPEIQKFCGLVPQEYAFYPKLTVIENLEFFAGVQGLAKAEAEAKARIAEVLAITGLGHTESKRAERFSGGMKRRLNIAIGLLNRPQLLLLDEPTVGIDPQSRHFILEAIKRINAQGCTVLYTTHYMEEVQALCDDIGILDNGRLLAHGPLEELLAMLPGKDEGRRNLEELFLHLTKRGLRD